MMNDRSNNGEIQLDDKTQCRVRLHHLANKHVLRRKNWDFHLEPIQTRSQNQQDPKAPAFEERSIEWTLSMEEQARKVAWIIHRNVHTVPGSYSEDRHKFFKTKSREEMFLNHLERCRKRENSL